MKRNVDIKRTLVWKIAACAVCAAVALVFLSGCGDGTAAATCGGRITVISREDGSGTRQAFSELLGLLEEGRDATTMDSEITQSAAVVMKAVEDNPDAIGYVSLKSVSGDVKVLRVDGVEPTTDNIESGKYPLARPFVLVTGENLPAAPRDFFNYIISRQGQRVVAAEGYSPFSIGTLKDYKGGGTKGKISVVGSTSVAPLVERLAEEYMALNRGAKVTIQQTGTASGIESVRKGACHIGMASRTLLDSETGKDIFAATFANDGIAVIVNKANPRDYISTERLRDIYKGVITSWEQVGGERAGER